MSRSRSSVDRAVHKIGALRLFILFGSPTIALLAYQNQSFELLLVLGCALPLLCLLPQSDRVNLASKRDPDTHLIEHDSLIRVMDAAFNTEPKHRKMACIAVRIDNFEELRRDLDAAALDGAIFETVDRIKTVLRSDDIIARLNEAEFAIFITSLRAPETSAVLALCDRLMKMTSPAIPIGGHALRLTVSAGFCINTRVPEETGSALLAAAQSALAEAQQNAPGAVRSYSKKTRVPVNSDLSSAALSALRDGQIIAWFQPQISTDTGEITGFEALARWDHPERGILLPEEFVFLFEQANQMEEFGENILGHALKALVAWDEAGVIVPSVAVNFATQELRNPSLVERIKWDVDRFGLDPSRLTVEVLETVISERDDDIITRNIRALSSQGFRIDLDDFGTGHASLSNIKRFAVDRIKIDRSFVARADSDPEQQRMIAAIVGLSERLGIETLAEGVETLGEQSLLSQLGCNHLQGFAITKPMPFVETLAWVAQHNATLQPPQIISKRLP
ncbi:MAG: GGDEF domain-containing protein [Pseudomonadota bacterium]